METRKITVKSTLTQSTHTIMSTATTLGELKADLTANNINHDNMIFREGLTRTEFIDDASVLPTNVMYKGNPTNELVFIISINGKKIDSGAENYTNECKKIVSFIEDYSIVYDNFLNFVDKPSTEVASWPPQVLIAFMEKSYPEYLKDILDVEKLKKEEKENISNNNRNCIDVQLRNAFINLIGILKDTDISYTDFILDESEVVALKDILNTPITECKEKHKSIPSAYNEEELENLFENL